MRLAALVLLIIANLLAGQAYAEHVTAQPLTRSDCDKTGMSWDANANVCGSAFKDPKTDDGRVGRSAAI